MWRRSMLVAAMMRTSTWISEIPPRCMKRRSCSTRRILACVSRPMVAISSRKSVPLSATSNRPFFEAMALVNAPLTWPNSVDSSRSVGMEPVLTGTKGLSRRGEFRWIALAMTSLPVPLSPCKQHRGAAVGHLRDQVENLQHGLAFAHDIFEVVALLQRALELDIFFFRAAPADRGAHIGQKFFVVPGLLYEIRRARLHGAHRILHRAVGGNHDDGQARVVGANLRKDFHAVAAGQRQIEQHQIKRAVRHLREAIFAADCGLDFEAFHFEQGLQRFANLGFIVNDEHRTGGRRIAVQRAAGEMTAASDMNCLPAQGKIEGKGRPGSRIAFYANFAGMLLNDSVGDGKSQAGSALLTFFGERSWW